MGRKIICLECNTIFDEDVLIQKNIGDICPVCGASLSGGTGSPLNEKTPGDEHSSWITWYYYGMKDKKGKIDAYLLKDSPVDLDEFGDVFFLIKEFKAPPEEECGLDEVKRILRTYIPDAFIYEEKPEPIIRCPRCFSTDFQLVPRKFSLLAGFATNKVDRVCTRCKTRF